VSLLRHCERRGFLQSAAGQHSGSWTQYASAGHILSCCVWLLVADSVSCSCNGNLHPGERPCALNCVAGLEYEINLLGFEGSKGSARRPAVETLEDFFEYLEIHVSPTMAWPQCRLLVGTRLLVSTHPRCLQDPLWMHFDEVWNEASFRLMCVETYCCSAHRHEICTSNCYPSLDNFLGATPNATPGNATDAVKMRGGVWQRKVVPITLTVVKRSDSEARLLTHLRTHWEHNTRGVYTPWWGLSPTDVALITSSKELAIAALCETCAGIKRLSDAVKQDRMAGPPVSFTEPLCCVRYGCCFPVCIF
jgi:hypothetical protein